MRNYYDFNGWGRDDRAASPRWAPGEKSGPYGEVPGAAPLPEGGQPHTRSPGARESAPLNRSGAARGFVGFAIFLTLLFVLAGGGLSLRGETPGGSLSLGGVWEWLDPRGVWGEWWKGDGWEEDYWQEELKDTDVALAPLGSGVTLTIRSSGEGDLTPREIYQKVNPAVVQVRAFLQRGYALGTGVVMSEEGYIITNAHVIAGARRLDVVFSDGGRTGALLVGYDGSTDLAVLQVESGLPESVVAEFGDSSAVRVGDPAYAIGNPLGSELRGTMTDGIISAIDRSVYMDGEEMTLLQTTAALNSGNSGGALINACGQVVGITNMKMMSEWETIEGLGFAIPTSVVKPVVDQIIETGAYAGTPMLGITCSTAGGGDGSPAGVQVESVTEGSDAQRQGLREGDVIIAANSIPVETLEDLLAVKAYVGLGETIWLEVWSPGTGESRIVGVKLMGSNELNG